MLGTEFLYGQGLGNQLFVYVTARAIAKERGFEFGTAGQDKLGNNMHSHEGVYFLDIDCGKNIPDEDISKYNIFDDDDTRLYLGNSNHDMQHGAYISGAKNSIHSVPDNTLLCGNLQDESYFDKYRDEIKQWLKVKPEYDSHKYTKDNLCILHLRAGDYSNNPELYLDRSYWLHGIKNMKKIRPDMEFLIITESIESAKKILPEYPMISQDIASDYVAIKNARYLLLGNSSFAVFPAMTSETVQYIIAPKYWARHNVSDGYWASEQNIYSFMNYMDKKGNIFTPDECRKELENYKKKSKKYANRNIRPAGINKMWQQLKVKLLYADFMFRKIIRKLERELGIIKKS
ncbi:MAG: glycosyl transferase [Butyrivibrio sp.]|nr:glycosyl transferase [Butyrivibrio sp.]